MNIKNYAILRVFGYIRHLFPVSLCGICIFSFLLAFEQTASAEGRAQVSFRKVFLPKLAENRQLLGVLRAFEIKDSGTCQALVGESVEYTFPCAFLARLKGASGPYEYVIIVDRIKSISEFGNVYIAGSKRFDSDSLGVAIWPLRVPVPFSKAQQ